MPAGRWTTNRPSSPKTRPIFHRQIRQFGSFAHAVMDYGASGEVAWRYSVFVDTAAQYMADLYAQLASGLPPGEAATLARRQLSASAERPIEDWSVPMVFEASPPHVRNANANGPTEECFRHLSTAAQHYEQSLALGPTTTHRRTK